MRWPPRPRTTVGVTAAWSGATGVRRARAVSTGRRQSGNHAIKPSSNKPTCCAVCSTERRRVSSNSTCRAASPSVRKKARESVATRTCHVVVVGNRGQREDAEMHQSDATGSNQKQSAASVRRSPACFAGCRRRCCGPSAARRSRAARRSAPSPAAGSPSRGARPLCPARRREGCWGWRRASGARARSAAPCGRGRAARGRIASRRARRAAPCPRTRRRSRRRTCAGRASPVRACSEGSAVRGAQREGDCARGGLCKRGAVRGGRGVGGAL